MTSRLTTIFMELLGEGTRCWRPVKAERLGSGLYRIVEITPAEEIWPFCMGDVVRCKIQKFQAGDPELVAYEKLSND